jgi:hypothetical protein
MGSSGRHCEGHCRTGASVSGSLDFHGTKSAGVGKWISASKALPPVGQRVECRHKNALPGYECTGEVDADGSWQCANAFIIPPRFLSFDPTHWRPLADQQPA